MTIKTAPTHQQSELFPDLLPDKPISKNGEARTRYGRVVEEIVCGLLQITDIPNSGSHDCVFDGYHKPSSTYCEIKSLRRGQKIPIYKWRIEKDAAAGVPLVYVIGIHDCRGCATLAGVWQRMAETIDTILVLPATEVARLAMAESLRTIGLEKTSSGGRNGYQRKGYKDGYYNVPWEKLRPRPGEWDSRLAITDVRGLPCEADVYFHPETEVGSWGL